MIILASKSEARNRLLKQAGLNFNAKSPEVDETALKLQHTVKTPGDTARFLAEAKALSVSAQNPQALVIGSDQTLDLHGEQFNQPLTKEVAATQLRALRGQTHTLHSAVAVAQNNQVLFEHCDSAKLTMRNFSDDWLQNYLTTASDATLHCVGSYQIESAGINLFERVEGDSFTIQGLPLLPLLAFLRDIGEIPV